MSTPDRHDEYEYILFDILNAIDSETQSIGRLNDLSHPFNLYGHNGVITETVFKRLSEDKIITLDEKWPVSVSNSAKKIFMILRYSIIDKIKFQELLLRLSEKYKNDIRRIGSDVDKRISIFFSPIKGIILASDPDCFYGIKGKRKEIFSIILKNKVARLDMLVEITGQSEQVVIESIAEINKHFSHKVLRMFGEKIIAHDESSGYRIDNSKYKVNT